ncbi:MAG: transmembrane 220 family protein [Bacteroidia bacterium]|nr:transmembrane 220 family protein [Bacteroidia bacterium]
MKILGYSFTVIFLAFTAVQYNDPDAAPWMLFYLLLAGLSLTAALGKAKSSWFVVAMIATAFGMGHYSEGVVEFLTNTDGITFSQGMQNDFMYIEQAREFGGLTISFLAMLAMWWRSASAS